MNRFNEYCYNLMEQAIKTGAEGYGISKEACCAYMNMIMGIRNFEEYVCGTNPEAGMTEEREEESYGEEMGDQER